MVTKYTQPVNNTGHLNNQNTKIFSMIDNYIYLYHTKTLIVIPTYPESIADNLANTFNEATPLSRSAPIFSFASAGPRSFQVSLNLHRDMMNEVNLATSKLKIDNLDDEDYVDRLIKELHAVALPRYAASEKMVDPPIVAVRFGNEIFCKGVVSGGITITYTGPILGYGENGSQSKYAQVNVDFQIKEIDPYDADSVMTVGGYRGLSTDLERRIYK
jgi:hypothetical protein